MNRIVKDNLVVFVLLLTMVACNDKVVQEKVIRPVKVEKPVHSQQLNKHINLPASINELSETKLSFRVGGPLVDLNNIVGSYVKAGEVIARLDQRDFKIGVEATKSIYELAMAEYKRFKNLVEKESVSKSTFDQVEAKYKLAKTEYESAVNAFKDTEIKAPFSGYINNVLVNNFEAVGPGQPIVSLLDMSEYEINGWISVTDASKINNSTQYTCIVKQGKEEFRIPGKFKEIGNKTSMSKQSLPITILINSPEEIKLRAGMSTYLEISISESKTTSSIQIPISAIFNKNDSTHVWIFNENTNTVSAKYVSTGKVLDNGNMEITTGLLGNENIIIAGANYLFEGQEVKKMEIHSKSNIGNKL